MDVKDMHISIPVAAALTPIEECMDQFGAVGLRNWCCAGVSGFLQLFEKYISSLFVKFDSKLYVQKGGISTRSCIAPVISGTYMAKGNRVLRSKLEQLELLWTFRFVYDFLLCFPFAKENQVCACLVHPFLSHPLSAVER